MGDEEPVEMKRRQMLRRPKIIISKCKKPGKSSKTVEGSKKVNGELSTVNKGKEDRSTVNKGKEDRSTVNKGKEDRSTVSSSEEVAIKKKNPVRKKTAINKNTKKRKLPESSNEKEVIVLDDDDDDEPQIIEEKASNGSGGKFYSPSLEFKGFKKRILAQTEKLKEGSIMDNKQGKIDLVPDLPSVTDNEDIRPKIVKITKAKKKPTTSGKKMGNEGNSDDSQGESQTEYAQYLGLQPTMQFKCYRCGERGFPSMLALNVHQRGCGVQKDNFIANLQQDTSSFVPSDPNMLTNFRITRKVYLCSACGTYYENWNLFLHMRDVHKKHICLFCLTMFGNAEKLSDHLKNIHSVLETTFNSSEEFQNAYQGSCYLICCSCENMFSERENYFHHHCERRDPTAKCNLCGVKCGHYFTCPKSNVSAINKNTATKSKATEEIWMGKKGQGDMYDVSDAASFCHVAIADDSGENERNIPDCSSMNIEIDLTTDNEVLMTEIPKNDETQNNELSESNTDMNNTKIGDQNEHLKNKPDEMKSSHESGSPTKSPIVINLEDEETEQEETESPKKIENISCVKEKEAIDKNGTRTECDDCRETTEEDNSVNQNSDSLQFERGKEQVTEDSGNKDEIATKSSIQISVDGKLVDTLNSNQKCETGEINYVTSDSESDTQPTNENESESSDENNTEKNKKIRKESIENKNEASTCESDSSVTSGLVLDAKTKNLNNDLEVSKEMSSDDTFKETETALDTKNLETSDTSKDFHLDDISSNEKDLQSEKENENEHIDRLEEGLPNSPIINDGIPLASEDIPAMALTLEDKLELASSQSVVKECVRTSCLNCVYCSHAVKIAVNGKQLALHLLAEHRYKPVKNNETSQDVVNKLKTSLNELEPIYFNTDSYDSSDKSLNSSYDYTYECFQCRFVTKVHKELYSHKRKMHQKTVLLCVMCKSNFYSYSELLCHMCPGIYVSEDIYFRCCFCNIDMIPSAFRLMVHLRKSHHTCDICLEIAGDQQKLSTHMWKHKLNHLCYRCGIAYRNKPDITKHLFWKHGTESVLCKKCLQKKWPHVYHFCIPPTVFICEECDVSFTKAVALKVHKRLHGGELPHSCEKCNQRFISRKLLVKHEDSHNKPPLSESSISKNDSDKKQIDSTDEHINVESIDEPSFENTTKDNSVEMSKENNDKPVGAPKSKKKKKRDKNSKLVLDDVYDLPPLNLSSESDSSDDETINSTSEHLKEKQAPDTNPPLTGINNDLLEPSMPEIVEPPEDNQTPAPIVDGVWDNFHSYKAELEKRECKDLSLPNILPSTSAEIKLPEPEKPPEMETPDVFLLDHNYCLIPDKFKSPENEQKGTITEPTHVEEATNEKPEEMPAPRGHSSSIDHAYATTSSSNVEGDHQPVLPVDQKPSTPPPQASTTPETHSSTSKKKKTPKKKKRNANSSSSSDSSSDSDSTNCTTCPPGCSCSNSSSSNSSSSSSSDSDSSTSEGRRRAAARKERKKERLKQKLAKETTTPPPPPPAQTPPPPPLPPSKEEPEVDDIPVEPLELPIKESDLDTDESSSDEDFYDKYPQRHATQQLEKRNKLMLLASVAPVNNGTVSPPLPPPPTSVAEDPAPQQPSPPVGKRKIKTKRRRKSQQSKKLSTKTKQAFSEPSTSLSIPNASSTPHEVRNHSLVTESASPLRTTLSTLHSDATAGSGSENENARLSKRKRVRNKFYGYSSEEEENEKPALKWRKVEPAPVPHFQPTLTMQRPHLLLSPMSAEKRPPSSESSGSDEEQVMKKNTYSNTSSSSSSESEKEIDSKEIVTKEQTEKTDNLYCYCQCPYDEVSEMIACDGQDCTIEWFHFECVGIMVPPKGKWYCPDCRKRRDMM